MFKIEEQTIYLTKGDSAYIRVKVEPDSYIAHEGDTITLSVKKKITDSGYAFQKVVAAGEVIHIIPEDTKNLDCGKYIYDVQLSTSYGDVFTIVEPSSFYIREEVTE